MPKVGPRSANSFFHRRPSQEISFFGGAYARKRQARPWVVTAFGTIGVAFLALYLAATGYLVFRDDLLNASIARQARIQNAYEDRIALLRADLDRLTSRHLLNQKAFDEKLEMLVARQAELNARQDIVVGLSQSIRGFGLIQPQDEAHQADENVLAPEDAESTDPMVTGSIVPTKAGQRAMLAIAQLRPTLGADPSVQMPPGKVAAIEKSIESLADKQISYVEDIADRVDRHAEKVLSVLNDLGHGLTEQDKKHAKTAGLGGPFMGLTSDAGRETFQDSVTSISAQIERLSTAKSNAEQLPLSTPLAKATISSRFGRRIDPFLKRPAFHGGVDFRAGHGNPVRATAAGKVIHAEFSGGYGKIVEIDHGNGITTRYGHLSRISVKVGDIVGKDDTVGHTGSTGRSTGPHLHYEVRVDDKPVDPMRYIRAGAEIIPLL